MPDLNTIVASTDAAIDKDQGEPVRIEPMAVGDGYTSSGATADATRPVATVIGTVSIMRGEPDRLAGQANDRAIPGLSRAAYRETKLHLSADAVAGLGYALRKDDRVVLTDRAMDNTFVVVDTSPGGYGDLFINLAVAS